MSNSVKTGSVIALACRLAAAHPEATLPCPRCSATLDAGRLEGHLAKVHPDEVQRAGQGEPLCVGGADRRIVYVAVGLMVASCVAMGMLITAFEQHSQALLLPFAILMALSVVSLMMAIQGLFKARLELVGDQLKLRWFLGLASRAVMLPASLESGVYWESRESGVSQVRQAERVNVGVYLRLRRDGASITIGARKAAGLGKTWAQDGWTKGKKTRHVDIEIDREGLIALEYYLAARGQLAPRVQD